MFEVLFCLRVNILSVIDSEFNINTTIIPKQMGYQIKGQQQFNAIMFNL